MPQMDGLECLDRIMVQRPCPVVMVSSVTAAGAEATLEALRLGAVDFVAKPTGAVSLRMQEFGPTLKEKVRTAAAARLPASHRLRERVQFRTGRRRCASAARGLTPRRSMIAQCSRAGPGSCWSAPRPVGHRRSKRCSRHCRRAFPGRSWSPSTCRQGLPDRSPSAWPGSARSAFSRSRNPRVWKPAVSTSDEAMPTSWSPGDLRARRDDRSLQPRLSVASQHGPAGPLGDAACSGHPAGRSIDDRHG